MKEEINKIGSGHLIDDARAIIETARANAVRSVDFCRVQMYWNLGRRIFEEEQHGKERADYGAYIVKTLADKLEAEYGSGFGVRQLERARQFYRIYPIASTVRTQLKSCYFCTEVFIYEYLRTKTATFFCRSFNN